MSDEIEDALRKGDIAALDRIRAILPDIATAPDMMIFAVEQGAPEAVAWMIAHGAPVRIEVDDGFPLMYLAVDRPNSAPHLRQGHRVLEIMIGAGGDLTERGHNDWTPLHVAAIRGDIDACRMLLNAGADRDARTRIDDFTTPEEDARALGQHSTADFIRDWKSDVH